MTTMRFFAAARAAVGVEQLEVGPAGGAGALGGAVDAVSLGTALAAVTAVDPERWSTLQERCSYLVDGITTRDRSTSLAGVTLVDVMPPFAGG